MQGRLEDLIDADAGPAGLALAQQALAMVQKLDPAGVAARDLRECLLLQLKPNMPLYEQLKTLISNHLEDLEHNRMPQIERRTGYNIEMIKHTLEELRKLNPKPGANYSSTYRAQRHARRVHRPDRGGPIQSAAGRRPHAELVHQPLLSQLLSRPTRTKRPANTSSARSIRRNG